MFSDDIPILEYHCVYSQFAELMNPSKNGVPQLPSVSEEHLSEEKLEMIRKLASESRYVNHDVIPLLDLKNS